MTTKSKPTEQPVTSLRCRRWLWLCAVVVLVACGSDGGDSAVEVAQAQVAAKEKALSAAREDAKAAARGLLRCQQRPTSARWTGTATC